MENIFNL